jgi:F420-non-reducing hydrogenase iron-sulfur subunit
MPDAPRVIGFVCDWAVATEPLTDDRGHLRDYPSVRILRVPCSGFMRPDWMEDALRAGADGAFVTGCPYGDCVNREGNYLMRERVEQLERRLQRRRVEPQRVAMLAYGLHDYDAFLEAVGQFLQRLEALPPAAAAGARRAPPVEAADEPARSGGTS